jgi:hypothetical protein
MIYQYLFYRLYKRQRTKFSELESVIFSSITIALMLAINLLTLEIFANKLFSMHSILMNSKISGAIFIIVFSGLNCFYFLFNKRYLILEQRFGYASRNRNNWGTFGIIAYVIFSFFVFFISVHFN